MEDNEIAAKRHKKRKTDCFYAPFASFCGYSLFPLCRLCCSLLSIYHRPPNLEGAAQTILADQTRADIRQKGVSQPLGHLSTRK